MCSSGYQWRCHLLELADLDNFIHEYRAVIGRSPTRALDAKYQHLRLSEIYGISDYINRRAVNQISCLRDFADEQEWIATLINFLNMASERACFEVYKTCAESCGRHFVEEMRSSHNDSWIQRRPATIEELFRSRFVDSTDKDVAAMQAPGDAKIKAKLPCGHVVKVRRIWIQSIAGQDCLKQKCAHCSKRIMQKDDKQELHRGKVYDEGARYRDEAESWLKLEALPPMSDSRLFDSSTLMSALNVAPQSFDVPESVSPSPLSPIKFDETELILQAFQDAFGGCMSSVAIVISPEALCGDLTECASDAVAKERFTNLTPGLEDFVNAWILRAVNLLCHRSCARRGKAHMGLYKHGSDWTSRSYSRGSKNKTSDADEAHNKFEDALDEVQRKIHDATMEDVGASQYEVEDIEGMTSAANVHEIGPSRRKAVYIPIA